MLRWLILLLLLAPMAQADQVEPSRTPELLSPQSRNWPRLAELPAVPREEIDGMLLERLRGAISSRDAGLAETPECSFMLRGFAGPKPQAELRRLGEDLTLSGPSPCREGAVTVIWRELKTAPKATDFPYAVLRLQPGGAATAIEPGCCG